MAQFEANRLIPGAHKPLDTPPKRVYHQSMASPINPHRPCVKIDTPPKYQVLPLLLRKTRKEPLLQLNLTIEEAWFIERALFECEGLIEFPENFAFSRFNLASKIQELSKLRLARRKQYAK